MSDEKFIKVALIEAQRGLGQTSPNPAVGAVIVRGSRIIARGFHQRAGLPHAEIEAIARLKTPELARGATLYVTLEPCSTHGKTPPCVGAIIAAGFGRVVVGTLDPNPRHAGRGIEMLLAAGIAVTVGVMEDACREINAAFNHWIVRGLPIVIAKAGLSLDGRLTRPPGESSWLTNPASQADAMRLRGSVDAVLVGAETVRVDNPRLTVRGIPHARQPWRVVLTRTNSLPKDATIFTDEHRDRTLVFVGKSLRTVIKELGRREITSLVIEGGGKILGEAFDRQLVDRVHFYLAPLICGGPVPAVGGRGVGASIVAPQIRNPQYQRIGDDLRLTGAVEYPAKAIN